MQVPGVPAETLRSCPIMTRSAEVPLATALAERYVPSTLKATLKVAEMVVELLSD